MQHLLFAGEDTEALMSVDVTYALNQLNRQTIQLTCDKIWPAMAHILINAYHQCLP